MEIMLDDIWILYSFVFIVFPIILFKNSNILNNNQYNYAFLSKNNVDIVKGIAVIMIFLSHTAQRICEGNIANRIFYYLFLYTGLLGVVIFLFLSGYGLVIQYRKNENYFKDFFIKKHARIYLTFFLANIITTILSNIFLDSRYGVIDVIKSSALIKFSTGRELWFIVIILYYYFVFYFAFKFLKKNNLGIFMFSSTLVYIAICIMLNKGEWWYNTAICFPIGIIFSMNIEKIYCFFKKYYSTILTLIIFLFLVCMILFEILHIQYIQFIIPIIFIILLVILLMKIKLQSNSINFINNISLEFYLLHGIVLDIVFKVKELKSAAYVLIAFIIAIILSKLLNSIVKIIFNNYLL